MTYTPKSEKKHKRNIILVFIALLLMSGTLGYSEGKLRAKFEHEAFTIQTEIDLVALLDGKLKENSVLKRTIHILTEIIKDKEFEIGILKDKLLGRNQVIAGQNKEIAEQDSQIGNMEDEIAELKEQLKKEEEEIVIKRDDPIDGGDDDGDKNDPVIDPDPGDDDGDKHKGKGKGHDKGKGKGHDKDRGKGHRK